MDRVNAAFAAGVPAGVSASVIGVLLSSAPPAVRRSWPLHSLPSAMAGPTPVSALIHAATNGDRRRVLVADVGAGISCMPSCLNLVRTNRRAHRLLRGDDRLVQTDIKRVLAYSTIAARLHVPRAGVGAYGVAIYPRRHPRLLQGLPVLAPAASSHAMSRRAGHRKMGALAKKDPITFAHLRHAPPPRSRLPPCRLLLQDEILWFAYGSRLRGAPWLAAGFGHCADDRLLHVPLLWLTFFGTPRMDEEVPHAHPQSPGGR